MDADRHRLLKDKYRFLKFSFSPKRIRIDFSIICVHQCLSVVSEFSRFYRDEPLAQMHYLSSFLIYVINLYSLLSTTIRAEIFSSVLN